MLNNNKKVLPGFRQQVRFKKRSDVTTINRAIKKLNKSNGDGKKTSFGLFVGGAALERAKEILSA